MSLPLLPFVEMIVTRVCNLVCNGCSTYSDLPDKGYVKWNDGQAALEPWLDRIAIRDFGFMGGEPLINPELSSWIYGIRELLPTTQIRLPTNALLLHKNLDIVDQMHDVGNCILKITVHTDDERIDNAIEYVRSRFKWEPVREYGIDRWITTNNMRFQINRPQQFFKTFRNDYANALPYDSNPDDAFAFCHQKQCPLLVNNRIYKCSTTGLMDSVLAKHNYPNSDQWARHLDNKFNGSIGLDSTTEEIESFVANVGRPHSTCQQCPTKETATTLSHLSEVKFR